MHQRGRAVITPKARKIEGDLGQTGDRGSIRNQQPAKTIEVPAKLIEKTARFFNRAVFIVGMGYLSKKSDNQPIKIAYKNCSPLLRIYPHLSAFITKTLPSASGWRSANLSNIKLSKFRP